MSKKKSKTLISLFCYGGGMRGLVPAHFMAYMEQVTGLRMVDMVDIFTGPSTGAILNAALNVPDPDDPARPKYRAKHLVKFYEREGIKIFPPDRFRAFRGLIHDFNNRTMKIGTLRHLFRYGNYESKNLAEPLRKLYGDTKLSDSLNSLVIPFYNLEGTPLDVTKERDETDDMPVHTKNNFVDQGGYAVWLKNIKYGINRRPPPDVSMFDAIMASTAAPTYFPSHHFELKHDHHKDSSKYAGIDGSIFDNPPVSYHGAIKQHVPNDTKVITILLGTGHTLRSFKGDDWNRFGGLGVVDPMNDLPLINILFHATETALVESYSQEMEDIFVFNKSIIDLGDHPARPTESIDDASPKNLKKMQHFFEETLEENRGKFEELCHVLVQNRDDRMKQHHEKPFWKKWIN